MHLDQMKQTFEKELHMKTSEFEGCIAEIQNEKDKYRAELDYMREENKVTNKQQEQVIETERHDYKMSIQDLRERYENEIAKRRTESDAITGKYEKERKQLMEKIQEQAGEIDKERDKFEKRI